MAPTKNLPKPIDPNNDTRGEDDLTDFERTALEIEKKRFRGQGGKEAYIIRRTTLPALRYYQRLNVLLDDPRLEKAEPELVRRLRDFRDAGRY